MAAKKKVKKTGSSKAKPKKGALKSASTKLAKVADLLSAQITSPSGPKLALEAGDLLTKRDEYTAAVGVAVTAKTTAEQAVADAVVAEEALNASIDTYVRRGGKIAAGSATVLTSLAIDVAAVKAPHTGPANAPTKLVVQMGADSGQSRMKWTRPTGAAAFLAQYKLEPATPSSPPTDWLPAEGHATNKVEWLVDGLPPAAILRGRVRSIGAEIGAWSDEVLGKAR